MQVLMIISRKSKFFCNFAVPHASAAAAAAAQHIRQQIPDAAQVQPAHVRPIHRLRGPQDSHGDESNHGAHSR
jgi:hypothetical protein